MTEKHITNSLRTIDFSIATKAHTYFYYGLALILAELLFRILQGMYEYLWHWKHYNEENRLRDIFIYSILKCDRKFYALMAPVSIIALSMSTKDDWFYLIDIFSNIYIPYIILRACNYTYNNITLAKCIRNSSGIDYATGMASSYFHGYLHLQLPTTGHETKGLKERISEYEDIHHVTVPVKKLFILIPRSMHTAPKIESKIMEKATPLEIVSLDRVGVRRPFKNAVYRIENCDPETKEPWYVVLEGATPMMSFWEALNYRPTATTAMADMTREITLQFYKSLKNMITLCPDTKGLVELIYYNDVEEGKDVDVGEIVKARIIMLLEQSKGQGMDEKCKMN